MEIDSSSSLKALKPLIVITGITLLTMVAVAALGTGIKTIYDPSYSLGNLKFNSLGPEFAIGMIVGGSLVLLVEGALLLKYGRNKNPPVTGKVSKPPMANPSPVLPPTTPAPLKRVNSAPSVLQTPTHAEPAPTFTIVVTPPPTTPNPEPPSEPEVTHEYVTMREAIALMHRCKLKQNEFFCFRDDRGGKWVVTKNDENVKPFSDYPSLKKTQTEKFLIHIDRSYILSSEPKK